MADQSDTVVLVEFVMPPEVLHVELGVPGPPGPPGPPGGPGVSGLDAFDVDLTLIYNVAKL